MVSIENELFDEAVLSVGASKHNSNPVITPLHIPRDIFCDEVVLTADPFLVYENGIFYLFYEIMGKNRKVIGVSSSLDGYNYKFLGIALDETSSRLRLSYPYVFM